MPRSHPSMAGHHVQPDPGALRSAQPQPRAGGIQSFHLLKNVLFPLLVLKGIYHYWKYVIYFLPGVLTKWKKANQGATKDTSTAGPTCIALEVI